MSTEKASDFPSQNISCDSFKNNSSTAEHTTHNTHFHVVCMKIKLFEGIVNLFTKKKLRL